jgi:magnesium-transporting ATPase (P-type)
MMKKIFLYIAVVILAVFGFLTLFLSTSVILDLFGVRAQEGNYVMFIVWVNFLSSLLYLFAVYGFIKNKKWTVTLLGVSSVILITAFIGLFIHIGYGGIYETKTIGAMIFRIILTIGFSLLAYFTLNKPRKLFSLKATNRV